MSVNGDRTHLGHRLEGEPAGTGCGGQEANDEGGHDPARRRTVVKAGFGHRGMATEQGDTTAIKRGENTGINTGTEKGAGGADEGAQEKQEAKGDGEGGQPLSHQRQQERGRGGSQKGGEKAKQERNKADGEEDSGELSTQTLGEQGTAGKSVRRRGLLEEHGLNDPAPADYENDEHDGGHYCDQADDRRRRDKLGRTQLEIVVNVVAREQPTCDPNRDQEQRQECYDAEGDETRGEAHEWQQKPPDNPRGFASSDLTAIQRTEEDRGEPCVLDEADGQQGDRREEKCQDATRREEKRDEGGAIEDGSAQKPFSDESEEWGAEETFEDSKEKGKADDLPPPQGDRGSNGVDDLSDS